MSTVTDVAPTTQYDPKAVVAMLFDRFRPESADQLISAAAAWMPALANGKSFQQEMVDRTMYLEGSMGADMDAVLKDRFPQTYGYVKKQMLNLKLYQRIVRSKARVFYGQGHRFVLHDEAGDSVQPKMQKRFDKMLKKGSWMTVAKTADRYVQALTRCLVRPWWDWRNCCVKFSVWPQHMVYWVPNPNYYWSPDDCYAVLLKMPGQAAISDADVRYELWAKIQDDTGKWKSILTRVGSKVTPGKDDKPAERSWYVNPINDTGENPFVNEETGEPVYPFVWWQADGLQQLYCTGGEDELTLPRQVNVGMTAMNHSMHYENDPIGYWEPFVDNPQAGPPSVSVMAPGVMVDGGEYKPAFASPGFDGPATLNVWEKLIDIGVQMDIGTASGVVQEAGSGESGLSIMIKREPLAEIRMDNVEIYRPFVETSMAKAIMVHNYYCEKGEEIEGTPCWEPGDVVEIQSKEDESKEWALKIETGAATVVDQVMYETGLDEGQALERVTKNLMLTAKLRKLMDSGNLGEIGGDDGLPDIDIKDEDLEDAGAAESQVSEEKQVAGAPASDEPIEE